MLNWAERTLRLVWTCLLCWAFGYTAGFADAFNAESELEKARALTDGFGIFLVVVVVAILIAVFWAPLVVGRVAKFMDHREKRDEDATPKSKSTDSSGREG